MAARPNAVRLLGVLNTIAGCAGGFVGFQFAFGVLFWASVFGSSAITPLGLLFILPLLLAGVLSAISGVCLLFSPERAQSVALWLLAVAVVHSSIHCVFIVSWVGLDPGSLRFVWLPGLVTLLAVIELFYLWPPNWYQFSLRTLLVVLTLFTVGVGVGSIALKNFKEFQETDTGVKD